MVFFSRVRCTLGWVFQKRPFWIIGVFCRPNAIDRWAVSKHWREFKAPAVMRKIIHWTSFFFFDPPRGGAGNFCLGGPKIWGFWVAVELRTTLTMLLDLHDYHKCHRSTLRVRTQELLAHWCYRIHQLTVDGTTATPFLRQVSITVF